MLMQFWLQVFSDRVQTGTKNTYENEIYVLFRVWKRVPLSSTHPLVQHVISTQGPLLFSPQNPSIQQKSVSSTSKTQKDWKPKKTCALVLVIRVPKHGTTCIKLSAISYSILYLRKKNYRARLYRDFVPKRRIEVTCWKDLLK